MGTEAGGGENGFDGGGVVATGDGDFLTALQVIGLLERDRKGTGLLPQLRIAESFTFGCDRSAVRVQLGRQTQQRHQVNPFGCDRFPQAKQAHRGQ